MLSESRLAAVCPSMFAESAHSSRSDRYGFVPTIDVVRKLVSEGFVPVDGKQAKCRDDDRRNFTKHLLRFRRDDRPVNGCVPEVVLLNSHDGSSAYQLIGGLFRFVCLNGLVIGDQYEVIRVQHTKSQVRDVIEGSFTIIDESRKALEQARRMSEIQLTTDEARLLAASVHRERFGDGSSGIGQLIPFDALLKPRRTEDQANDLFTVMNRVQENAVSGGLRVWSQGQRSTSREVKGIDQSVRLNRSIWGFAEQLYQLKAA